MKLWKKLLCATSIVSGIVLWMASLEIKDAWGGILMFGAALLLGCYGVILFFHESVSTTRRE